MLSNSLGVNLKLCGKPKAHNLATKKLKEAISDAQNKNLIVPLNQSPSS